jgi:hypothetical protein
MNIVQVTMQVTERVTEQVRMHVRTCLRALLLISLLLGPGAASAESQVPKKPGGYLPVEDVPKRADPAMSPDDRAKLVKDLAAARDRQAPQKPKDRTKPAKP